MVTKKLLIIGNGMVGHKLIENMVESGQTEYEIITFCEEPRFAYDRVQLSAYFSGKTAEDLSMVSPGFYEKNQVNVLLNEKAETIDCAQKSVTTASGKTVNYDKLVIATGSYPFVPPIPGHDQPHCLVYRTIEDLEAIKASASQSKIGVVVGGGLLGLEAANALRELGVQTHVVEFAPRLMAVQIDDGAGSLLRAKIEALGVQVHTNKNTQNIVAGENARYKMCFADGSELETDMILFSAGIRPRDELAKQAGIAMGPRGGIIINDNCQTSDPDVYAIGECALWNNFIFGLVAPGYQMAKVACQQLLGQAKDTFTGADMSTKLKLLGVDVASIGDAHAKATGSLSYRYHDEVNGIYKKIVVDADKKKLLGAILVGDASDYGNLLQMYLNGMDLPANPELLILPEMEGMEKPSMGVDALPDSAQICSCHDVTKGQLCAAVQGGVHELGELKSCTKAGTGCGGCAQLIGQVLNNELSKLGIEVKKDICEHFPYSRQEIYHLVRVGQIKSFEELLEKHGTGHGCEICRPVAGSVLASCWNDYILKGSNVSLQDTNDVYLGNMQKDGTYSIVPRVAGGEITPEKLIVLGQVAKQYNLYTKITGGQRIDLFGAQLNDLPAIWKLLVDAGFETGHAYGKSLRTVKSCVGSTWCRYGVDDSVGLAIDLENRYKGLRSPHKIKFGVSGCTRECAEAQSKDVGVIATEKGWNLYLCGNGGMKPRHADLFATDLDRETLIKYIDRFLMFYVKTADRLQRTSVWFSNLEGGLDYLRQVVIEDSLGLAAELEQQMQHVVDTYQCEWKTTIEDPEQVKRFRHYVNSDSKDANVIFVQERGQIRPATETEKNQLATSA